MDTTAGVHLQIMVKSKPLRCACRQ